MNQGITKKCTHAAVPAPTHVDQQKALYIDHNFTRVVAMKNKHSEIPLQQYFHILSRTITRKAPIAIGVSGGPDSMFLAHVVLAYYDAMGWARELIHIVHFNHGQRDESQAEQRFVIGAFPDCYAYWNTEIPPAPLGETELRNLRHRFFQQVVDQEHIGMLLLGHNLTDRIETSLFNMVRGATHSGRIGMSPIQKHTKYTIIRPLLLRSKSHILHACQHNNIPYMIDASNGETTNPRNILRNDIIPRLCALHAGGEMMWEKSWSALYTKISSNSPLLMQGVKRSTHIPHPSRGAVSWRSLPLYCLRVDHLRELCSGSSQVSHEDLTRLRNSFISKKLTYHYAYGHYFFLSNEVLHCVQGGSMAFWENEVLVSKPIIRSGELQFDGNIYSILSEWVGGTIRYPQRGDVFRGKPLRKILLNRKIPLFMRSTTPLIELAGEIVAILS